MKRLVINLFIAHEQALGALWRELPRNEAEGGAVWSVT